MSFLMFSERRPDERALGGVEVHVATLGRGAAPLLGGRALFTAYVEGQVLIVERCPLARPVAVFPLLGDLQSDHARGGALGRALTSVCAGLGVQLLHVHSPHFAPSAVSRALRSLRSLRAAGVATLGPRLGLTLHDHALALRADRPRIGTGWAADSARAGRGDAWAEAPGAARQEEGSLRSGANPLVELADFVIAPSRSVLRAVTAAQPRVGAVAQLLPWGVEPPSVRVPSDVALDRGPLRVAVVGRQTADKGAEVLAELVRACAALPLEWHVFGAGEGRSTRSLRAAAPHLRVHGAYRRDELASLLAEQRCALALLPSVVPEGFCLTLSELAAAGVPVVASSLGALRERVLGLDGDGVDGVARGGVRTHTSAAGPLGWCFDVSDPQSLAAALGALERDRPAIVRVAQGLSHLPVRTTAAMVREHVEVWQHFAPLPHTVAPERDGAFREACRVAAEGARRRSLRHALGALRASQWYRDLPLRGALPEHTRARAERLALRLLQRREAGR